MGVGRGEDVMRHSKFSREQAEDRYQANIGDHELRLAVEFNTNDQAIFITTCLGHHSCQESSVSC